MYGYCTCYTNGYVSYNFLIFSAGNKLNNFNRFTALNEEVCQSNRGPYTSKRSA